MTEFVRIPDLSLLKLQVVVSSDLIFLLVVIVFLLTLVVFTIIRLKMSDL